MKNRLILVYFLIFFQFNFILLFFPNFSLRCYNRNMKKIYLISIIAIVIGSIFAINPYWFKFLWGFQILLIPLTTGILMVLVQNKDKSYDYIPKLLIGSTLVSFGYAFVFLIIDYVNNSEYRIKSFPETIDIISISMFALPLVCICLFGGLIGLVIRGTNLLLSKNKKYEKV